MRTPISANRLTQPGSPVTSATSAHSPACRNSKGKSSFGMGFYSGRTALEIQSHYYLSTLYLASSTKKKENGISRKIGNSTSACRGCLGEPSRVSGRVGLVQLYPPAPAGRP